MRITIYIHPELSQEIMDSGTEGATALGRLSRQAIITAQTHGKDITYAPLYLPDGRGCAMSVKPKKSGLIVEIDPPGSALKNEGVVVHRAPKKSPNTGEVVVRRSPQKGQSCHWQNGPKGWEGRWG